MSNSLQVFYEKLLWWILWENNHEGVSFLLKFHAYRLNKTSAQMFFCEFYQIFQNAVLQNTSGSLLLLNTLFCSLGRPQPQKMFPSNLVILNISVINTQICLQTVLSEAATGGVLWKKVFLEISQNSQENTCVRVSFLIKLQASTKFLRTPF